LAKRPKNKGFAEVFGFEALLSGIFMFCLVIHLYFSFVGWNNTILDRHEFRQTQTAISAFYMVKDGPKIDYETPVLGKPWAIPMEFPTYQFMVATLVRYLHAPLDQTGRFVSLLFFYLSLIPVYFILGRFVENRSYRLMMLSFILLNPIYLFWSRTFMIESTALFFSIMYLLFFIRTLEHPDRRNILAVILLGSIAALTKTTTFAVFLFPCLIFWIYYSLKGKGKDPIRKLTEPFLLARSSLVVGVPVLISMAWIHYSDALKSASPLAAGSITSKALSNWNYGTIAQKLSAEVWRHIFDNSAIFNTLFANGLVFLAIAICLLMNRKRWAETTVLFACFIFAPMIFTNLYFVHDYYFYANGLFFSLALGFAVVSVLESDNGRSGLIAGLLLFYILQSLAIAQYRERYLNVQQINNISLQNICLSIRQHTAADDVILIYGYDWSPPIPYYSGRKALMDPWNMPIDDPRFRSELKLLGGSKVGGMVICNKYAWSNMDRAAQNRFINERADLFRFDREPVFDDSIYKLYISR
jgi:Dolichyl-phosphate-mannose-protein mannosyltransferase